MVDIHFFNGARTKSAWDDTSPDFIDDWKPEERTIRCERVQVTYGKHIKMYGVVDRRAAGEWIDLVDLWFDGSLVPFEGVFYGDFIIAADDAN